MENIDISVWNKKVEKAFLNTKTKIPQFEKELLTIIEVLSKNLSVEERTTLQKRQKELTDTIIDLTNDTSFGFYLIEAQEFLNDVPKEEPKNFTGKDNKCVNNDLSISFLELIKKYNTLLNLDIPVLEKEVPKNMVCPKCNNKKDFEIVDNRLVFCLKCSIQIKETLGNKSTFKDVERVNVSSKYKYIRMIHMHDCVRQYQGKQKVKILPQVIRDIKEQLILDGIKTPNPQHIRAALQVLGYSSHYENYILIWSKVTEKVCPDISHLEEKIYQDFELIEKEYNILMNDEARSSFMSYPYVLYQELRRYKVKLDINFFNMLKNDRIEWLDEVMEKIYLRLEWTGFKPLLWILSRNS